MPIEQGKYCGWCLKPYNSTPNEPLTNQSSTNLKSFVENGNINFLIERNFSYLNKCCWYDILLPRKFNRQIKYQRDKRNKKNIEMGKALEFNIHDQGTVRFQNKLCVPQGTQIREKYFSRSPQLKIFHPSRIYWFKEKKFCRVTWEGK